MFINTSQYERDLAKGLSLSGEGQEYFLSGRVSLIQDVLSRTRIKVESILDFGCGSGHSTPVLQRAFDANVCGYDTSDSLVAEAEGSYSTERIRFVNSMKMLDRNEFDLCYTNGVFHHIDPADRRACLEQIHRVLKPFGLFAFFENNPWNPGTRLLMSRIPFDRDAKVLSYLAARKMLLAQGFEPLTPPQFVFYFPKILARLRPLERLGLRIPLGAQYLLLMKKIRW